MCAQVCEVTAGAVALDGMMHVQAAVKHVRSAAVKSMPLCSATGCSTVGTLHTHDV